MRIGFIHITGLAATLLLALVAIGWIDGRGHMTQCSGTVGDSTIGGLSGSGKLSFYVYRSDWAPGPQFEMSRSTATGLGNLFTMSMLDDPEQSWALVLDGGVRKLEWDHYEPGYESVLIDGEERIVRSAVSAPTFDLTPSYGVVVPHWFVVVLLAIPTLMYWRFIWRRGRVASDEGAS